MSGIKAIIWDMEGVLLHAKGGSISAAIARRLGVPAEEIHNIFHSDFLQRMDVGEFTQDDFWNHILTSVCLPRERKSDLLNFFNEDLYIDQEILTQVRQYKRQFKTGLLSNFSDVLRPMLESGWSMDGAFDEVVISCEVGIAKPSAAIYETMLARLGCQAGQAIFIDDKQANVDGAAKLGMHAFLFSGRETMDASIRTILTA